MKRTIILLILLALILAACSTPNSLSPAASQPSPTSSEPAASVAPTTIASSGSVSPTLTVMTHSSFAMSDAVKEDFERQNHVKLEILKAGDAGEELNRAILAKGQPLADVYYGVDNTLLSRALVEGLFEPYNAPALGSIPEEFKLDASSSALPVDYGDVCLNYDIGYFKDHNLTPPGSLEDLLLPQYKSLLVVENPATSSPGLAFLLTTVSHFGADKYLDYWKSLAANDVKVVNDWESAYNKEFSRAGGTRPIVLSYSSSPAFELLYANPPVSEPPTAAIVAPGTCFRQVEFVGILKGTPHRDLAEKWVDFMLSATFQEDMPLQMYVFPVLSGAKLDPAFVKALVNPTQPAYLDPAQISANREKWLQAWTETVLR